MTFEISPNVNASEWFAVDGQPTYFAHALLTKPEYYVIKTGNVTTDGNEFFLFQNNPELDWAVITEYNAQVPEPGTLLLLGSGLVGLAIAGRKFKS